MRNGDRPACFGGSGSCIISFRLDAADQRNFLVSLPISNTAVHYPNNPVVSKGLKVSDTKSGSLKVMEY